MKTKKQERSDERQNAEHTPTPWVIIPREYELTNYKAEIHGHGKDSYPVAYLTGIPEDDANAKFIVRAVNSHETTLHALKAARIFLLDDELYAQTKELRNTLDQAITEAEKL